MAKHDSNTPAASANDLTTLQGFRQAAANAFLRIRAASSPYTRDLESELSYAGIRAKVSQDDSDYTAVVTTEDGDYLPYGLKRENVNDAYAAEKEAEALKSARSAFRYRIKSMTSTDAYPRLSKDEAIQVLTDLGLPQAAMPVVSTVVDAIVIFNGKFESFSRTVEQDLTTEEAQAALELQFTEKLPMDEKLLAAFPGITGIQPSVKGVYVMPTLDWNEYDGS